MRYRNHMDSDYSPLYFLASLGSGGLAVSFFIYLMFMVPHPGHPIPIFEDIIRALLEGGLSMIGLIVIGTLGIVFFAVQHFRLLYWNIVQYFRFRKTEAFRVLKKSDAEVQLMAIPLTYGMAINVVFIIGAAFVPRLWSSVEYLFPFALVAFLGVGIYALKIIITFFARVIAFGHFHCEQNNSLSQMLSIFALSMVAVGFAAPGAMSHQQMVSGIGIIFSVAFMGIAAVLTVIKIVLGFRAMFEHGINKESAVSLWIVIPILTIMGITLFRVSAGLHHNFNVHINSWSHVLLFTVIAMLQIFFGILGYSVMKHIGYCKAFISGTSKSVTAYAAICPGVAFFVMGNFFINQGLVPTGLLVQFSIPYFALYLILIAIQVKTIQVLGRLNRKLLNVQT